MPHQDYKQRANKDQEQYKLNSRLERCKVEPT